MKASINKALSAARVDTVNKMHRATCLDATCYNSLPAVVPW